jgi:hypothetical protein
MTPDKFAEFGIRLPDIGETPLSWEEVLVWLRIRNCQ